MDYDFRSKKKYFPTNRISQRGYIRELKYLLLGACPSPGDNPEYSKVANALEAQLRERKCLPENGIFPEGTFNKWWNEESLPGQRNRDLIATVYPSLEEKWFSRKKFSNRLQQHLACLDLPYIFHNLDRQDAVEQAVSILQNIGEDWKPRNARYFNAIDISLMGPKKRSGLNVHKKLMDNIGAKYRGDKSEARDPREFIEFGLEMEAPSFVGINLPGGMEDLYQENNILSIIPFMFALVCMGLNNGSNYLLDLIFDFLSALICASIFLYTKYESLALFSDKTEKLVFELWLHFSEYVYEEDWSVEDKVRNYENLLQERNAQVKAGIQHISDLVHPITHINCHSTGPISDLFLEVLGWMVSEKELEEVYKAESLENSEYFPYYSKYASAINVHILETLNKARDDFLEHFKLVGFTEKQLMSEFQKAINPPFEEIGVCA